MSTRSIRLGLIASAAHAQGQPSIGPDWKSRAQFTVILPQRSEEATKGGHARWPRRNPTS